MLGPQIRKRINSLLFCHLPLLIALYRFIVSVQLKLFISSVITALNEAAKLFLTLEDRYAKVLAIGRHLRNVCGNERDLDNQVDFSRSLQRDGPVRLLILLGNTRLGERIVLECKVYLAMNRLYIRQ